MSSKLLASTTEIEYIFVWSEKTGEEPEPYQKDSFSGMRIRIIAVEPNADGTYPCTADFKLVNLQAMFTCSYNPSIDLFSDFELMESTAKGGMENAKSVIVSFHRELDGEEIRVPDEHGNLFMFVQVEFGYEEDVPIAGDVWGKKAMRGERNWWKLTAKERQDLELDRWDEEQRNAHFALLAQRKKKKVELAEQAEQAEQGEGDTEMAKQGEGEEDLGWVRVGRAGRARW